MAPQTARAHVVVEEHARQAEPRAMRIAEVAERLAISPRSIERQLQAGTFPIPPLPSLGTRTRRWSSVDVDRYLEVAATHPGFQRRHR